MSEEDQKSQSPENRTPKVLSLLMLGGMLVWETGKEVVGLLRQTGSKSASGFPADSEAAEADANQSDREYDRDITHQSKASFRWGTFLGVLFCLAALCGGVGFVVAYWTGGSNEEIGGFFALFFAGLALGLVVNARMLSIHKEAVEPREDTQSPPEERDAAALEFRCGKHLLQRRGLLKWMTAVGLGSVAAMFVSLFRSFMPNPYTTVLGKVWTKGQRLMTLDGKPVKADSLTPGSTTIVFPEDSIGAERSQTVLVRVNPQFLELPAGRGDWAPQGNLAFSRICTHAGCPVGMYEKTAHLLMCPCHQSTFDVLRAAQPTGGPAARSLPQLPLYVDSDGMLCAGSDFTQPPGPGFWEMPS